MSLATLMLNVVLGLLGFAFTAAGQMKVRTSEEKLIEMMAFSGPFDTLPYDS